MNFFKISLISLAIFSIISCTKNKETVLLLKAVDLGTVSSNDTVHSSIEITNLMKENLIIKKASSSCGCTSITIKDSIVKPNSKTRLDFDFIAAFNGDKGYTSKAIVLETNSPQRFHEIIINAKVE